MPRNPDDQHDVLVRAYPVATLIAISAASLVGTIFFVAALGVQIGFQWTDKQVPNYAAVLSAVALIATLGIPLLAVSILLKNAVSILSFYRNKVQTLDAAITQLEEIAHTDPITRTLIPRRCSLS